MHKLVTVLVMLPLLAPLADVQVPVMVRTLKAGEAITPDAVAVRTIANNKVFAGTVKHLDELTNMQAAHLLKVGEPITRLQIKPAMAVARDSAVTLRWSKGGVVLEGSGRTLDGGNIGDTVRVMSPASRQVVHGVIADKGIVEIR